MNQRLFALLWPNNVLRILFEKISWVLFLSVVLLLMACATPVGVRPLHSKEANRRLTENVLSDAKLSGPTLQILNRAGLEKQFQTDPAEGIAALHQALPSAREADRLFALAELSFLHAAQSGDRSYFLAAAVYAYAFLFPQGSGASPDPFDPRFRTAVDLYNRGHMTPENSRKFFMEYVRQINSLKGNPEWYNTITTNCTTDVVRLVRAYGGKARYNWKVLFSGYAPQYAYENGSLDTRIPFEKLRKLSYINSKTRAIGDDPQFSRKIREGLPRQED
jgi:hypothetical protein